MSIEFALGKIINGEDLSVDESRDAFDHIFTGDVDADTIATFLLSLVKKGESADELLGAVISMRSKAITIEAPSNAIDIVGTGGDQLHTLNISTAVALVVASCGVPVAKHGNRASSSRSGSSDVLRELGINLEPELAVLERCLHEANLCFLFAPRHHPAMRHVADVRRQLGVRTIFNLLGPLTNPANVKRHMIGVYEKEWLGSMASVLKSLGSEMAWLAHGQDDMDEITTTTGTDLVEMKDGHMRYFTMTPEEFGFPRAHINDIRGEDAAYNAVQIRRLLRGVKSPYRDIVLMNAAAALIVGNAAVDMEEGIAMAMHALDNGDTYNTLDKIVTISNKSEL